MDLRPVDLPRLREDLIAFISSPVILHEGSLMPLARVIAKGFREDGLDVADPDAHLHHERATLKNAAMFYVAEDMCYLASQAAKSLPDFTLLPEDVPSDRGLVWLAAALTDSDKHGRPFRIAALGWAAEATRVGVWIYIDRDSVPPEFELRQLPPIFPFGFWRTPIGDDEVPKRLQHSYAGVEWVAVLKTIWLLMAQDGIADMAEAQPDRATRKHARREGKEPPVIRVITLRCPAGHTAADGGGREWHHSWVVRGHWRQARVGAGRLERRPVWVRPHVKGPADAPLLGGEKVYEVQAPRQGESAA